MKSKTINSIVGAIIITLVFAVWKLNSYYKQEKSSTIEGQIHQQTLSLKTAISSQLTQLRNIISGYQGQIDESKINWVQLNPFYALVQVDISSQGVYTVKHLYVKSGTLAENWSKEYIQKALSYSRFSNQATHVQLFQNQAGEKFLTLLFSDEKIKNSRRAVAIVGDASYFQKYFDLQRSAKTTNLLLTNEAVVVGHTQSDYIATRTQEEKLSPQKFYLDKDQIRASNLSLLSYSSQLASGQLFHMPLFVLVFVVGLALVLIGLLLYALKPIQSENRKAEIFKKVFDEVQKTAAPTPVAVKPPSLPLLPEPLHEEKTEEIEISQITQRGIERIKLSSIVDLALVSLETKMKEREIYIEKHYESDRHYDVDVERFRKAIENIISNSIEAQAREIIFKVYDVPGITGMVTNVDITDDGQGIETSSVEKIWQPFYGTKDKLQHKGLGLPEALSVARRYGANIKLAENKMGGTTLRIEMDADNRVSDSMQVLVAPSTPVVEERDELDLDIDSILSLDDVEEIEKELTTTQFKIDRRIEILDEPQIQFQKSDKKIDHLEVKVRRPGKT